ncbi:MAG: acylphosphatase [Actinobacteria bacterium]|nr:acylphosphatase [Actinomycetota bacterium]
MTGRNPLPDAPRPQRLTALVSGQVQGVGYRRYAQRRASDLGLAGFAENLHDGKVEVVAEGEPEAVERLQRWCRQGPPRAEVTSVEALDEDPEGLGGFSTC